MSSTTKPKLSIIIPSWTGEVSRLTHSIEQQTFNDYEIHVIKGISPAGRARNVGAQQAKADILLFIDDDAYPGNEHALQLLVKLLEDDDQTAIAGTSKLIPEDANRLQHMIATQIPRWVYPIVSENLASNPPLDSYGFTAITTTCCAVRRTVFEEVGGFDERMLTAEDTDFFYRVRSQGYNLAVAANCWVYHDPPATMKALLRKSFFYGVSHALEARKSPERGMAVLPLNRWYGYLGLLGLIMAMPLGFFVHYYFDPVRRFVFGFRPLKTLSTYATLCGYVYGWHNKKSYKLIASR